MSLEEPGMLAVADPESRQYWVDAADRLVAVNDACDHFAVKNGAPELIRDPVLGRPL